MSSLQEIHDLVVQQDDAFAKFKAHYDERLTGLREHILKMQRPGAMPGPTATDAKAEPWLIDRDTGQRMIVLQKGDDIAGKMRAAGRSMDTGDADAKPTFAEFLRAVAGMRAEPWAQKALSVGTDAAGGYAVPSLLMADLIDALIPQSSLLSAGARIVPLTEPGKSYRFAKIESLPTAAWRAEAGSVGASDPTFSAIDFTPKSLSFRFKVSRELLQDAPNIDNGLIGRIAAQAMAVALDAAGLRGNGSAPTPRGILNQSNVNAVTNGTNGASLATIKWSNLNAAYQAILEDNAPAPTAAIMAPRTLVGFSSLADTTGQPLRRPDLLGSLRFIPTTQIPVNLTVGSSTDCTEIYVGDFTRFWWGIRESLSVLASPHTAAATGEVEFFCHSRADCVVEYGQAFALITGVRP